MKSADPNRPEKLVYHGRDVPLTVSLNNIIEALDLAFDEMPSYLDLTTDEVRSVHSDLLELAEGDRG